MKRLINKKIMLGQPIDKRTGRFSSPYEVPVDEKTLGAKIPQTVYDWVSKLADNAGKTKTYWLREAIAEKMDREGAPHELIHHLLQQPQTNKKKQKIQKKKGTQQKRKGGSPLKE